MRDRNWRTQSYLGQETGCLDKKEKALRGAHWHPLVTKYSSGPPIPPVSLPLPTATHSFGVCDTLSPPRGGWSSCSLERGKTPPYTQLLDYIACLHKQIDLRPTQKSPLLLGRPESERAPPKQQSGRGAESRCRVEHKQGFTLVQACDSAEIHRQPRQVWP